MMGQGRSAWLARAAVHYALPLAWTATVAWLTIRAILAKTGGELALPLDDSFIHFQYARSFAELHPLRYTPASAATPGATSLLWPACLSLFYAAGVRDTALVAVAWAFGFGALGLLALETRRLALGLTSAESAFCAGLMVLAFGGYAWFAASGMEVVPFAWLLTRSARRAAEWHELWPLTARGVFPGADLPLARHLRARRVELCALAWLTPLMRPEGALASLLVFAALLASSRGRARLWAAVPLVGPALAPAFNRLFTGQAMNTTALSKWLLVSPYHYGGRVQELILYNVRLLFETLLDGQIWTALFWPTGVHLIVWLCLPALLVAGARERRLFRTCAVLLLALGMLIPATYDSFLWNRVRYIWPFVPGWLIGYAALCDMLASAAARIRPELSGVRWLFGGLGIGAFATHISPAIDDVATSSDAIRRQQVALGRWARDALPKDALIGVNDTGAIAYFSERRTFDVVGLTTANEAKYWTLGAGSRFEHYEKLPAGALPTHFIVYPEWFAIPGLLGEQLDERTVLGATILGGTTMAAYRADYHLLRSGELPEGVAASLILDALDVADAESEAEHGYELYAATQLDDVVVEDASDERADGARIKRELERFELVLEPGGTLVARVGSAAALRVRVQIAGRNVGELELAPDEWQELRVALPGGIPSGRQVVELRAPAAHTFSALHYWSLKAQFPARTTP